MKRRIVCEIETDDQVGKIDIYREDDKGDRSTLYQLWYDQKSAYMPPQIKIFVDGMSIPAVLT